MLDKYRRSTIVNMSTYTVYTHPVGGQVDPSSIVGDSLEWKNAQKMIRRIELPIQ